MYRKVNALEEHNLVGKSTEIDTDGHHYAGFTSNVQSGELIMDPADREVIVDVIFRRRPDQFTHLWKCLRQ